MIESSVLKSKLGVMRIEREFYEFLYKIYYTFSSYPQSLEKCLVDSDSVNNLHYSRRLEKNT